jgi:hypothetical protein
MSGWIGVDFDGTLATYGTWAGADHVGEPIAPMVERVKRWLAEGREVRIFTARISGLDKCFTIEMQPTIGYDGELVVDRDSDAAKALHAIRAWCRQHIGQVLPITNVKDYGMIELWDDRAVQVRANTGEVVGRSTRGLA